MKTSISFPIIQIFGLGCVCLAFCWLMVFTPLFSDDWNYYLIFGTDQPISSLHDIFISQYSHYFLNNGRFIPHFFVQLFDGVLGKPLFNFANTAVFLVFILLLIRKQNKTEWTLFPIAFVLLLLLMPGFNNAFLWLSGACNYLWTATLLLTFDWLMNKSAIKAPYYPLLFLFGVACGWTNEALIIGFVTGCLCFYTFHRKELKPHRTVLLAGLVIGALFLTLAPGSIHRFMKGKDGAFSMIGFAHQFFSSLLAMDNLRLFPLLLLILLPLSVFKKLPKGFFSENLLWFVAVITSFVFILFTGHQADHSRFGIELYSLILILQLLRHFTIPKSAIVISCVISCLVLAQTLYYSCLNHQEYERCVAQIEKNGAGIIETNEVKCPPLFDRLIVRFKPSEESDYYACESDWIERYFGKEKLLFLPHRFMERIRQDQNAFEDFETKTDLPFYARKTDADSARLAVFHLSDTPIKDIPLLLRPFADKMERYTAQEVESSKVTTITLPQGRFVLVMKNHMIANRVVSISVQ